MALVTDLEMRKFYRLSALALADRLEAAVRQAATLTARDVHARRTELFADEISLIHRARRAGRLPSAQKALMVFALDFFLGLNRDAVDALIADANGEDVPGPWTLESVALKADYGAYGAGPLALTADERGKRAAFAHWTDNARLVLGGAEAAQWLRWLLRTGADGNSALSLWSAVERDHAEALEMDTARSVEIVSASGISPAEAREVHASFWAPVGPVAGYLPNGELFGAPASGQGISHGHALRQANGDPDWHGGA